MMPIALMIAVIGSPEFSSREKRRMPMVMACVGTLQAFDVLLQGFGVDPFCMQKPGWLRLNRLGGVRGNRISWRLSARWSSPSR
jgi:hypothetical protein